MAWIVSAISGLSAGTGALLGGALGLGGSLISSNAAQNAAQTQANAANQSTALQQQIYQQNLQNMQPYLQAGQTGLSSLMNAMPSLTGTFTNQDLTNNLAPNYQFMLNQGLGANAQNVNVGGGGSNVNRSNQVFAQNYAQNAYQQAFNNWLNNRQSNISNLLVPANIGLGAAGSLAGTSTQAGANIGSSMIGAGTASAAGQVGSANALAGGLTGVGNSALLASLLNGSQNTANTNTNNPNIYAG
jgi:hypothetical protein